MELLLNELTSLQGVSGRENLVREKILSLIEPFAECKVDALGNIIAFKKGLNKPSKRLMLDAHMDEVGFIITSVNSEGFLRFATVGGIDTRVIIGRRVLINGITGIIGCAPIHLLNSEQRKKNPTIDSLYIDIGALNKEDAFKYVSLGDVGVFESDYVEFGEGLIKAKALDDRAGCAILIDLIRCELLYDMYFTFTVQEEVGLCGAKTAVYGVEPDYAIVVETTTAADIANVSSDKQVCALGQGAVISFMDRHTLYDKNLVDLALNVAKANGIKAQVKSAVAGGNNAGAIHVGKSGVRTIAVSMPCRYLHSGSCVINHEDYYSVRSLVEKLANEILGMSV